MSDDTSKKATVLPLMHNDKGDFRGLVLDSNGIRAAEFRKLEDGKPIMGEFVEMTPREGSPLLNAEFTRLPGMPTLEPQVTRSTRSGPPNVATPAYREGWDRIFGKKSDIGEA